MDVLGNATTTSEQDREKDRAIPRFYVEAVPVSGSVENEGRPLYEDREFVELRHPGDRSYNFITEVNAEMKARFPQHYAHFKQGLAEPDYGTPIEKWPVLKPSEVLNLKAMAIRTIEDLATIPDSGLAHLGHAGRTLRDQAGAWLESAARGAGAVKAAKELEDAKAMVALRDQQIADLAARLDALENKKPRARAEA